MSSTNQTLVILACLPILGAAEPASPTPPTQVVDVSARREALTASDAASAAAAAAQTAGGTAVVRGDDLAKGRTSTLRDALGMVPGVYIQPRFGAEESRLSIRGSGIQRTFHMRGILLLQDGQPINQADGGGDFQTLDPAIVDHITVERGANALRYGAANLGGAIDYVSPTGLTAPAARLRVEGGSFGSIKGVADGGLVRGPVDAYVAVSGYRQDGWRDHSRQENLRFSGNLGWRISPTLENRFFVAFSDSDSELPGSLTKAQTIANSKQAAVSSVLVDSKRDYTATRVADRLVAAWDSERVELGVGLIRKELFHPLSFGITVQDSEDWAFNARFETSAPLAGLGNRFLIGLNGYQGLTDALTYTYAKPNSRSNAIGVKSAEALQTATGFELYAEERMAVATGLWAIVGLQVVSAEREYEDRFLANGDQSGQKSWRFANPKLGVLYEASPEIQVFANASRSAEPPSFAEYIQANIAGPSRPQQALQAQTAWTVELGSRGTWSRFHWDATAYQAWIRDEYLSYAISPGITNTINADRTQHTGLELGLDAVLARDLAASGDRLVLAQVYTWGRFRFDGDRIWGSRQLPGMPENTWRGDLRYEAGPWYGGLGVEWQQGWPVDFAGTLQADDSWLLSAKAGYRGASGFSAFIEGRNLTDQDYIATTSIANPAQPAANQAVFNPGDGLCLTGGAEWRF